MINLCTYIHKSMYVLSLISRILTQTQHQKGHIDMVEVRAKLRCPYTKLLSVAKNSRKTACYLTLILYPLLSEFDFGTTITSLFVCTLAE
jgi:hypothetical protein